VLLRRLAFLITIAFVATLVVPGQASGQDADGSRGDPNCDGTSDIIDALVIAQFVAGTRSGVASCPLANPATEMATDLADADFSGTVDIIDALQVAQCTAEIPNFGCASQVIEVLPPLAPLVVSIGVDGFVPLLAGDQIYAIERTGATIACLSRVTGTACWAPRPLLVNEGGGTTMAVTRSAVVGDRIFFMIRDGSTDQLATSGTLRLACWDTVTDALCAASATLPFTPSGVLHVTDDAAYVFTEYRDVYCFGLTDFKQCAGYEGGRATALQDEQMWVSDDGSDAWHGDVIADGDRVYATMSDSGAVWLHCWDVAAIAACAGFEPSLLNDTRFDTTDAATAGRLFFHRSTSGDPIAICSQGERDGIDCRDLVTGVEDAGAEADLSTVASTISYGDRGLGISTYHPDSNRQLFVGTTDVSTTYCHNFDTNSYCGSFAAFANGADTGAYGYATEGSCAVGLGDAGYVYFMDPGSLSSGCAAPVSLTEIDPCQCPDLWPRLKVVQVEGLSQFLIDVRDEDLEQVALIDALATDIIDLNEVVGDARRLRFVYSAVPAPGQDPWVDGEPPTILFS
jgi:hypothetical protein